MIKQIDDVVFERTPECLKASINGSLVMTRRKNGEWTGENAAPLFAIFKVTAALVKLRESEGVAR